ncbi:MAG: gamma-glutamylcyclotransferase [Caulobacteraceae bacterium]|nr:gamma-glutamylcyclotransferase [Caulobacteraceae bacterium]
MSPPGPDLRLFSYGTLRLAAVQRALFGREVETTPDALPGYALSTILIRSAEVVATSGEARHAIVRPSDSPGARVDGAVLTLTPAELAAADTYETDDYRRIVAKLASGVTAFVYVAANNQ